MKNMETKTSSLKSKNSFLAGDGRWSLKFTMLKFLKLDSKATSEIKLDDTMAIQSGYVWIACNTFFYLPNLILSLKHCNNLEVILSVLLTLTGHITFIFDKAKLSRKSSICAFHPKKVMESKRFLWNKIHPYQK